MTMPKVLMVAGLLLLGLLWLGPLPSAAGSSFAAHMTMHMGVVAVAAPLIALGLVQARRDPVRAAPRWFAPVPISVLELVVVWAWHAPALHHFARQSATGLVAEQGSFLLCGALLWAASFSREGGGGRAGAGIAGLLLTSMHMTLLGALLALSPRPLYVHFPAEGAPAGWIPMLSPLADQQLGGAIMLLVGGVSYLAGGLALTGILLQRRALDARRPL